MARAMGAYCSEPVPNLSAMGIMPIMVAKDVIRIGRKRTRQAVMTASTNGRPCSSRRWAKSTIRILLEFAMPTSMSTPIKDITFIVVLVNSSVSSTPVIPIGIARMMRIGSTNDLNWAVRIR